MRMALPEDENSGGSRSGVAGKNGGRTKERGHDISCPYCALGRGGELVLGGFDFGDFFARYGFEFAAHGVGGEAGAEERSSAG
jgi:hypothetical protein